MFGADVPPMTSLAATCSNDLGAAVHNQVLTVEGEGNCDVAVQLLTTASTEFTRFWTNPTTISFECFGDIIVIESNLKNLSDHQAKTDECNADVELLNEMVEARCSRLYMKYCLRMLSDPTTRARLDTSNRSIS
jgi:hypothetical protein